MFTLTTETEEDEELAIEAKRALAYLQKKRSYRYVEFIAQGGYGWVSLVRDDSTQRTLAVKCTTDTTEMEIGWWPRLRHPNILPLLEYLTLDNCTVFIMPAMRKDLWKCVTEPRFYDEELSFGLCRIWLRDVAFALNYLHSQRLCHLDLKLDNVFLKEDGFACLGDFSLLSNVDEVPQGFHFLELYEPPEFTDWCHGLPPKVIADANKFGGDKADMWQYGILALDLLTDLKLTGNKSSYLSMWHHDVWPFLQKVLLHKEYLDYLLENTFQTYLFKEKEFRACFDYLSKLLCLCPDDRLSADKIVEHEFLDAPWPSLPGEFELPKLVVEHKPEPLPLPLEEPDVKPAEEEEIQETPSIGAVDVLKRKMKKIKKEKFGRRESIIEAAGKRPAEIKAAPDIKLLPKGQEVKRTVKLPPKPVAAKVGEGLTKKRVFTKKKTFIGSKFKHKKNSEKK